MGRPVPPRHHSVDTGVLQAEWVTLTLQGFYIKAGPLAICMWAPCRARQHADGGAQEHQEIEMAARSGGADEKGQGDASAGAAGKGGQPHAGADVEAGGGQPSRAAAPDWLEVERKGSWRGRCAAITAQPLVTLLQGVRPVTLRQGLCRVLQHTASSSDLELCW